MTQEPLVTGIIDLHHHDGSYDLNAARERGMVALIHKATQGKDWRDPKFSAAMGLAAQARLLRGAYHFGSNSEEGEVQADFFLDRVASVVGDDAADALLVLDWENNPDATNGTMSADNARRFVKRVHEVTGRWPVLYSFTHFLKTHLPGRDEVLANCPLWQSQFGEPPSKPASPTWQAIDLWQYTNGADGPRDQQRYPRKTPGFAREAQDRSAFRGTVEQLTAWWANAGR